MRKSGQNEERETLPDGNQQSTITAWGGMIHSPRTAEQADRPSPELIQHFICVLLLLFFILDLGYDQKCKKGSRTASIWVFLNNNSPGAISLLSVQHYGAHPAGREVSRELDASLNSATIDYHSIRLRLGSAACRRGAAGEEKEEWIPNTHKPVLIAEMLPRQKW